MANNRIVVRGAREHNLKSIDVGGQVKICSTRCRGV
jgi:excinuclease UvrABC ATPase subunit